MRTIFDYNTKVLAEALSKIESEKLKLFAAGTFGACWTNWRTHKDCIVVKEGLIRKFHTNCRYQDQIIEHKPKRSKHPILAEFFTF